MVICTWNVFSVNQAGRLRSPSDEFKKYKIGTDALQEIRRKSDGVMNTGNFTFFYSSNRNNTLLTSRIYKHSVVEFESFNERVRTCGKSAIEKPRNGWLDNVEN
jgi:hypothetical protein